MSENEPAGGDAMSGLGNARQLQEGPLDVRWDEAPAHGHKTEDTAPADRVLQDMERVEGGGDANIVHGISVTSGSGAGGGGGIIGRRASPSAEVNMDNIALDAALEVELDATPSPHSAVDNDVSVAQPITIATSSDIYGDRTNTATDNDEDEALDRLGADFEDIALNRLGADFEDIALGLGDEQRNTDEENVVSELETSRHRRASNALGRVAAMLVGGSSSSNVSATTVSAATASMTATSRGSSHGIFAFHGRQRSTAGVSHSPATSVSQRPPERRASAATSLFGSASPIDALARIVSSYGDITSGSTRTSSAAVAAPVVRETTSAAAPPLPPGTVSTAHDDAPFVNVDYNDSGQVRVRRSDSVESMFTVHQPAKLLPPKAAPSSTSSRPSSSASSIGGKRVSKSQMELQVSLTRQRTLPPKNAEEEQRHLAEHQKMMREFQKKVDKERRQREERVKRRDKFFAKTLPIWERNVLPDWEKWRSQRKLADLWKYGLPPIVRGKVWKLVIGNLLGVNQEIYDICQEKAQILLEAAAAREREAEADVGAPLSPPTTLTKLKAGTIELIQHDLDRTFPTLGLFQQGRPYHDDLRRILHGFVAYRPDIGYVQGMSYIAATLLINMPALDAFIALCNVLHHPLHQAFFRMDAVELRRYFAAFEVLLGERLPRVAQVFREQAIDVSMFLLDWLLTIYTRSLPLDIASRLWDWYLLRGEAYLFQAGLGLLHHLEGRIVRQDWDANMYDLTHTVPAERLDEEEFFDSVQRMHVSHAEFVRVTSMSANHAVSGVSVATSDAISSAVCDAASPGTARADKSDTCADVSLS